MSSLEQVVIGVTGLQAACDPSPGLAVARALSVASSRGWSLVALDYDPTCTGLYVHDLFTDRRVLAWRDDPEIMVERLLEIRASCGINVLLPCLDSDVLLYAAMREELDACGVATLLPPPEALARASKTQLGDLASAVGINVPPTTVCSDRSQLEDAISRAQLPAVVKGHNCGAFVARSRHMLKIQGRYASRILGFPILLQDFVEGQEYSVCSVAGRTNESLGSVVVKKIGITDEGKMWMGVTVGMSELEDLSRMLARELGWVGPFEVDVLRRDQQDEWLLLDLNPRFPAWIDAAPGAGANPVETAVMECLDGGTPAAMRVKTGIALVKDFQDIVLSMTEVEQFGRSSADGSLEEMYRRV